MRDHFGFDHIDDLNQRVRRLERDIIAALLVSGIVGIAFAIHQFMELP